MSERPCRQPDCPGFGGRPGTAWDLCHRHYARLLKYGDPSEPARRVDWSAGEIAAAERILNRTADGLARARPGEVAELAERIGRTVPAVRTKLMKLRAERRKSRVRGASPMRLRRAWRALERLSRDLARYVLRAATGARP